MIWSGTNKWKDDKTKCPCVPYTASVCVLSFFIMNIYIWITVRPLGNRPTVQHSRSIVLLEVYSEAKEARFEA